MLKIMKHFIESSLPPLWKGKNDCGNTLLMVKNDLLEHFSNTTDKTDKIDDGPTSLLIILSTISAAKKRRWIKIEAKK